MFKKILIANRGEIACRIATTCRHLGVQTVAIYSDADIHARHTRLCDEAIYIGPAEARASYLNIERIIAAAVATNAQAIHPGYGFLSENAEFAQACTNAGLIFIGPPVQAIKAMGSKSAAKTLMAAAGVPLVPGYHGERQDADFLEQQAQTIAYPILLKASAGGGGKGMRIVENKTDFKNALAACQREAAHSFGDTHVLLEKYLDKPRHIEVQIFADQFGNCIHLFERDCSVQRRHQKVLEEAPAPHFSASQREKIGLTAITAAKAVGYVGAGTVEFIVDSAGTFYFMEMNTRLQVEHPVTEMITGQDLVSWQLQVAAGQALPLKQSELAIHGHAIEARIYAENPEKDFLPATGTLHYLQLPHAVEFRGNVDTHASAAPSSPIRIDSGVVEGDTISPYYDPMIAKLIAWGETREQALARLRQAMSEFKVIGLTTNINFLTRLLNSSAFTQAELDTGLIGRHQEALFPPPSPLSFRLLAGAVAALLTEERHTINANSIKAVSSNLAINPSIAFPSQAYLSSESPWVQGDSWRNGRPYRRPLDFSYGDQKISVILSYDKEGLYLEAHDKQLGMRRSRLYFTHHQHSYHLQLDHEQYAVSVFSQENHFFIYTNEENAQLHYLNPLVQDVSHDHTENQLTAPMPGKILAIHAQQGQTVSKGMPLLVMEAMKMEHTISAPRDGVIDTIHYLAGEQVAEGAQLLSLALEE